jgi:hypothetical protein
MKRTLCLALFGLLCCGLSVAMAAEAPSAVPADEPLPFLAPNCGSMTPVQPAVATPEVLPQELLLPEPRPTASCTVSVICRCGQRLSCTSASGNCQRVLGCSVTCDGNEQVCPPCNGFACA